LPRASGVDAAEFMVTHHHYDHADAGTSTCSSRSSACASSGRDRLHIARVRYGRPDQRPRPPVGSWLPYRNVDEYGRPSGSLRGSPSGQVSMGERRRARRDNRAPRWRRRAHERVPRLQPRRLRSRNVGGLLPFAGRLGL